MAERLINEVDKLDPRRFYEYAARQRAQVATGLEAFVYRIIPYKYIGSFAFAIDPLARFKVASSRITPTNRTIRIERRSVLHDIRGTSLFVGMTYSSIPNYNGVTGLNSPHVVLAVPPDVRRSDEWLDTQRTIPWERLDTTIRTRPIGSTQGEFKNFKFDLFSPPRSWEVVERNRAYFHFGPGNVQKLFQDFSIGRGYYPSAATISPSTLSSLREDAYSTLQAELNKNILSMFRSVMPSSRKYTLFRNVVELKDLPRSVSTLKQTAESLLNIYSTIRSAKLKRLLHDFSTTADQVPKEYLSYMFGWRQLYKDAMGLLSFSEEATKRVNFLNSRSGKETNLRITRKYPLDTLTDVSGFSYPVNSLREIDRSTKTSHLREVELRLVINNIVDFPPIDSPVFRRKEFLRQLGVVPTIGDLYELIPWTWLTDWYFGLANYIQLMEQINKDNSLINWGLSTAILRGKLVTTFEYAVESLDTDIVDGVTTERRNKTRFSHTSSCEYTARMRINAANSLSKVSVASEGRYFTDFQNSILGALLAQRGGFHR